MVVTKPNAGRPLGLLGVLGGSVLLAAFAMPIPLNFLRLLLFNIGAAAVAVGVYLQYSRVGLVGVVPVVLANTWYAAMVLVALGIAEPLDDGFGLVFFMAGTAMWLTDAWFGAALLANARDNWSTRLGGFALLVGSLLAFTGLDRLGLTADGYEVIFIPLALAGIFLNGCGWILLGGWLAYRRTSAPRS